MSAIHAPRLVPSEFNTAMPPAWRWERARWLRANKKRPRRGVDDEWVSLACQFLDEVAKASTGAACLRLACKYPALYWAWYWYDQPEKQTRWTLEAYLCAGESVPAAAGRVSQHPLTVGFYTKLFFDVVGRTGDIAYMLNEVLGRSIHDGVTARQYDLLWKYFGLLKGPAFLTSIIHDDCHPGQPVSPNQVAAARAELFKDQATTKALVAMKTLPVAYNQELVFNAYCKLAEIEKKADTAAQAQTMVSQALHEMFTSASFHHGRPPARVDSSQLRHYDERGIEPRSRDLVKLALGEAIEAREITLDKPEAKDGTTRQSR